MRLWSIHPKYLDAKGLVALWREGLLAQKVLEGGTQGYRNHPQLQRFKMCPRPLDTIGGYLESVHAEAMNRGYWFSHEKIVYGKRMKGMTVTRGQLEFEWGHLLRKVETRSPSVYQVI